MERNQTRKTMLISVNEIKSNTLISQNVDDSYIATTIMTAQEIYLSKIIGTSLYYSLQTLVYNQIKNTTPSIYDDEHKLYNELLQELVKPLLKYRVSVDLLYNISFKIRNAGVVRNSDTNVSYAPLDEIKYLEKQFLSYYDSYCDKISRYLSANCMSFPELSEQTPCYYDQAMLDKDFANSGGLFLGSSDKQKNNCSC